MLDPEDSTILLNEGLEASKRIENAQLVPSVIYRPTLSLDGNLWCALYGEDLQEGVAGFGASPELAMKAFDEAFKTQLIELVVTEVKVSSKQVVHPGAILNGHMCVQQMSLDYLVKYSGLSYNLLKDFLDLKIEMTPEMPECFKVAMHTDPQIYRDAQEAWTMRHHLKKDVAIIPPEHPAELVKSYMHSAGISVNFLATSGNLDINELKDFLEHKIDMTLQMRLAFTRVLHTKPEIWVDAQNAWKKDTFPPFPKTPRHPGLVLKDVIEQDGGNVSMLSLQTTIPLVLLKELVLGKGSIDVIIDRELTWRYKTDVKYWLNLQEEWDKYNGL